MATKNAEVIGKFKIVFNTYYDERIPISTSSNISLKEKVKVQGMEFTTVRSDLLLINLLLRYGRDD